MQSLHTQFFLWLGWHSSNCFAQIEKCTCRAWTWLAWPLPESDTHLWCWLVGSRKKQVRLHFAKLRLWAQPLGDWNRSCLVVGCPLRNASAEKEIRNCWRAIGPLDRAGEDVSSCWSTRRYGDPQASIGDGSGDQQWWQATTQWRRPGDAPASRSSWGLWSWSWIGSALWRLGSYWTRRRCSGWWNSTSSRSCWSTSPSDAGWWTRSTSGSTCTCWRSSTWTGEPGWWTTSSKWSRTRTTWFWLGAAGIAAWKFQWSWKASRWWDPIRTWRCGRIHRSRFEDIAWWRWRDSPLSHWRWSGRSIDPTWTECQEHWSTTSWTRASSGTRTSTRWEQCRSGAD